MHVLTIQVQDEVDDRAAEVLAALTDIGKLDGFMAAIVEGRDLWTVLCWLEEDLLRFAGRNPWCGALDGWRLVVGTCPYLLEDVPEYTGYGVVGAWLLYEGDWVMTIVPPEVRQREETADVLVWDAGYFEEMYGAIPLASVVFAEDSGMRLNAAMRQVRAEIVEMETAYGMEDWT